MLTAREHGTCYDVVVSRAGAKVPHDVSRVLEFMDMVAELPERRRRDRKAEVREVPVGRDLRDGLRFVVRKGGEQMHKDLKGHQIYEEDWYWFARAGEAVESRYVLGWPTDERRLNTGRVLKMGCGAGRVSREQAKAYFAKKGVRNTVEA